LLLEILPSPPENVEVEAVTEKSLKVSWTRPSQNAETILTYVVNVTMLRSFDEDTEMSNDSYAAADSYALAASGLSNTSMRPSTSTLSPQEHRNSQMKVGSSMVPVSIRNFDGETFCKTVMWKTENKVGGQNWD
jgi:hypothetical protein